AGSPSFMGQDALSALRRARRQWRPSMPQRKPLSLEAEKLWTAWTSQALAHAAHRNKNRKSGQFMCYINRTVSGAFYTLVRPPLNPLRNAPINRCPARNRLLGQLGCSQAVRQRILIPPCPGSNPGTPARPASKRSRLGGFFASKGSTRR